MIQRYREAFQLIWAYLRDHLKENWHPTYYLSVAAFATLLIWLNYGMLPHGTIEGWIIKTFQRNEWGILAYLGLYALPYYGTLVLLGLIRQDWSWAQKRGFWWRSLLGLFLLSFDGAFYYYQLIGDLATAYATRYFLYKISANLISAVCMGLPLWLVKRWWDREQENLYGLSFQGFEYRPYVLMLAIMVPIVLGASFLPGFISYYPTLKLQYVQKLTTPPFWAAVGLYELIYLLDFVWTELIFRGFFVIGLIGVLGAKSVLPMSTLYVSRHFAKPMGECISSFFGGYVLGVIALRSRNIMGGVLIHMGIAFLMEVFALGQWWWRFG